MEQVKITEANSEVLVFLDINFPTKLSALQEAVRVLQREVIRYEANPSRRFDR